MFEKFIEKRREKQRVEEEREREELLKMEEASQKKVDGYHDAMVSRPCAINRGCNCSDKCVHFRAGSVKTGIFYGASGVYKYPEYAKCKLWK